MSHRRIELIFIVVSILLLAIAFSPSITGLFVLAEPENLVSENLDISFLESTTENWNPLLSSEQYISSVKISGTYYGAGQIKIYLVDNEKEYLLFDNAENTVLAITGFFVLDENKTQEEPEQDIPIEEIPESEPEQETENQTTETEIPEQSNENIEPEINPVNESEEQIIEENQTTETEIPEQTPERLYGFEFDDQCTDACDVQISNTNLQLRIDLEGDIRGIINNIVYSVKTSEIPEQTIEENQTKEQEIIEPELEENATLLTLETQIQHSAEIGKLVKWTKNIKVLDKTLNSIEIELPENAQDIKIFEISDEFGSTEITDILLEEESLFGAASQDLISGKKHISVNTSNDLEVEYYTEAPQITEIQISKYIKEVTISSETHYQNILTYTDIPETLESKVSLYWIVNGTGILVQDAEFIDTNNNNLIDKIQWITPHLSEQTYQIIIEISAAEHLDENRTFISDIYNEVYQLDGIWSETINENEYIRVTFEQDLDSTRDITIYPRVIFGKPIIEVYEENSNQIVATFENLISNSYNKVYLTNLQGIQNTFDLRVVGGSVEFDHIIDPTEVISSPSASTGASWT